MSLSLPTDPPAARSLTAVWANVLAAIDGRSSWWRPVQGAVVVVVDGLGAANLADRSGHARFLTSRAVKRDVARTVFPSTTAAALSSLMTGVGPGEHGVVGYRVRVPGSGAIVNQLTGWDEPGVLPADWQRAEPVLVGQSRRGRPTFVVGPPEHVGSGFTGAILRGASYTAAGGVDDAVDAAIEISRAHVGALVYVYVPELDRIGHKRGWESEEWSAALERVDAAAARLDAGLGGDVGGVLTADHGMVDVPRHRHVLLSHGDDVLREVAAIAGEPRMLHIYLEEGADHAAALARWQSQESARSWVVSRAEAIAADLFGPVSAEVTPRIGDILVAARAGIAYYDDRVTDKRPQHMIGQHGSLTPAERVVPLLRLGAFAP